jgi:hypothetical protein
MASVEETCLEATSWAFGERGQAFLLDMDGVIPVAPVKVCAEPGTGM